MKLVAASLLSADYLHLGRDITALEQHGIDILHIDVMDGHFVPNMAYGMDQIVSIKKGSTKVTDVHLMTTEPERWIPKLLDIGIDMISFHYEAPADLKSLIHMIKEGRSKAGIVINPNTKVALLEDILPLLDFVLVMSVEPGKGGQSFLPNTVEKIRLLDQKRKEKNLTYLIEVDGGINFETAKDCFEVGADILIAGSFMFKNPDIKHTIEGIRYA